MVNHLNLPVFLAVFPVFVSLITLKTRNISQLPVFTGNDSSDRKFDITPGLINPNSKCPQFSDRKDIEKNEPRPALILPIRKDRFSMEISFCDKFFQ